MNDLVTQPRSRGNLTSRFADKYGLDPGRVLPTLKATAFRTGKDKPPATDEQMIALMIVAEQYHLNPFTKELFAFPDKGGIVPVVSVDGWSRIINEHPQFDGFDAVFDDDSQSYTITMYRKDRSHPIRITEYMVECRRDTDPWKSHPRRMLRHKALIQAARVAFGFAGIYDVDEAERIVDMGDVERVEPQSTGAQRVRAILSPNPSQAPVALVPDITNALGALMRDITAAPNADAAALVLDQARELDLTPEEHDKLTAHFYELWDQPNQLSEEPNQ